MSDQYFFVYILHCDNDTYYTGYTIDLEKRYLSHVNGTGQCKYTRSFKPKNIAQCWRIDGDKAFAMELERRIKKLSRAEKDNIIVNPGLLLTDARISIMQLSEITAIVQNSF